MENFSTGMQNRNFYYTVGVILFVCLFYFLFINEPDNFPTGTILKIEQGETLRHVSFKLEQNHIIKSRLAFEAFVILLDKERVVSTDYYFESKLPVYEVARRIARGESHIAPIAVTIPEGFTISDIADACVARLPSFNKNNFISIAKDKEGYLFPDTYFFLRTDGEVEVLKSMSDNFDKKIASLKQKIIASGKNESEIIIMASIIEREAKGNFGGGSDRGIISGILWHRLALGMPLQVDAAPETYKSKGLPQNPISNPGLEAIVSAIQPIVSPYLYYLHDKTGAVHYAKSYAEHQDNIKKYLK